MFIRPTIINRGLSCCRLNRVLFAFQTCKLATISEDDRQAAHDVWKARWDTVQESVKQQEEFVEQYGQPSLVQWFPGHMYKASKEMEEILRTSNVSLVLEIRDARIPFSSANPMIEGLLDELKIDRILVLNKSDLVSKSQQRKIKQFFIENNKNIQNVIYTNAKQQNTIKHLLDSSIAFVQERNTKNTKIDTFKIFIVGMPNVGKSTIINGFKRITAAIRTRNLPEEQVEFIEAYKAKNNVKEVPFTLMDTHIVPETRNRHGKKRSRTQPCKTGARAGVTRSIETFVISKNYPRIVCLDSPGIMMPKLHNPQQAFRLASIGSLPDSVVGEEMIGDYLLWMLNSKNCHIYVDHYKLETVHTNFLELVDKIAKSIGALNKNSTFNRTRASMRFITDFRKGHLGHLLLDDPDEFIAKARAKIGPLDPNLPKIFTVEPLEIFTLDDDQHAEPVGIEKE